MVRTSAAVLLLAISMAGSQEIAPPARRVALVIGNSDYTHLPPLPYVRRQLPLVEDALKKAHFDVHVVQNLTWPAFHNSGNEDRLKDQLHAGDICFIYYAGYAAQVSADDDNYLLPVNFDPRTPGDMDKRAYHFNRLVHMLEDQGVSLKIFLIDGPPQIDTPIVGVRAGDAGLMEPPVSESKETYYALAVAPGRWAPAVSNGGMGLLTTAYVKYMAEPGLSLGEVFDKALAEVGSATGQSQILASRSSVVMQRQFNFIDAPIKPPTETEEQRRAQALRNQDDGAWEVARNANTKSAFEAYLKQFDAPLHAAEARDLMAKVPDPVVPPLIVINNSKLPYRNPIDKSEYMLIPGGAFQAGCREDDSACGPEEPRRHTVTLPESGFWMGRTEVTVQAYKLFLEAHKQYKMPPPSDDNRHWDYTDHPMIKVSWKEAQAYCEWVGGSLPTGDEWERAARGGKDTRYPWGDEIQPNQAKYQKSPVKSGVVTAPVRSYEPNGYGLFDVVGNVWEWTKDVGAKGIHQTRGGSWYADAKRLHVTSVRTFNSDEGVNEIGFRCLLPQLPPGASPGN